MKKVLVMISVTLAARLVVAQEPNIDSLMGEDWYGLYMNGQKCGWAMSRLSRSDTGEVIALDDAQYQLSMFGAKQELRTRSERTYAMDGRLVRIESRVDDPASTKRYTLETNKGGAVLRTMIGDVAEETPIPLPKESLADYVKNARLTGTEAKVGDTLTVSAFDPMLENETEVTSTIVAIEERTFEGVPTKVFKVKSLIHSLGLESVAYIDESGTLLEDIVAGIITMRLEPKEVAQDVDYSNDVIVSNAALVETPIKNPRGRSRLRMRMEGPLTGDHIFNDERQQITPDNGAFVFEATRTVMDDYEAARLPITEPTVIEWIKPTLYVQSDDPALIAKSKEIVGDETDAAKISEKLCYWVKDNVRTVYSAQLTNAVEVLKRLEGDCTEHSILFIGLARAAGLPAREVAGLIYTDTGGPAGFYFHQWAKVWVGKWIDVDPTFNQPTADVTHIKLSEGDLLEQSRLIPVIGQIKVAPIEDGSES
jgi:hypothetical protein